MSRVSLIEQLYKPKRKSALEFEYDSLWAPPIFSIIPHSDVMELYNIANSLKLSGKINKKYKLIDDIMKRNGFVKWNSGTNRVTYRYMWSDSFIAKIAIDRVGMSNNPAEYRNQFYIKPFCCKIFEVDPTGVLAFVERVNPISSIAEFLSVAEDVFNMMVTKIIGRYVADDLGTEKYMNYGVRQNANGTTFGPVVLDFPSIYPLDPNKLFCHKLITTKDGIEECNGEIDYDDGLNHLICTRCGAKYNAEDLALDTTNTIRMYGAKNGGNRLMKVKIVDGDGNVISGSLLKSSTIVARSHMNDFAPAKAPKEGMVVSKTIREKSTHIKTKRERIRTSIRENFIRGIQQQEREAHKDSESSIAKTVVPNSTNRYLGGPRINVQTVYDGDRNTPIIRKVSKAIDSDNNVVFQQMPNTEQIKAVESEAIPEMEHVIDPKTQPIKVEDEAVVEDAVEQVVDAVEEEPEDDHLEEEAVIEPPMEDDESEEEPVVVPVEEQVEEESGDLQEAIVSALHEAIHSTKEDLYTFDPDAYDEQEEQAFKNEEFEEEPVATYNIKGVSNKEHKKSKSKKGSSKNSSKNYDDMSDY